VGGGIGLISGFLNAKKVRKQEQETQTRIRNDQAMVDQNSSNARIAYNPSLVEGYKHAQMFAAGGVLEGGGGKKVDKVPDGYNFDREEGTKKYYTKKTAIGLGMAAGSGRGGVQYESFLKEQLGNGITPEDLAAKKYIGADLIGKYKAFYKPSSDTVYTEPNPVNVQPEAAKRGQAIYLPNKHIAGEIFYGSRDSKDVNDGGTLNTAVQTARIKFRNDFGFTGEELDLPGSEVQKYLGTSHTFGNDGLYKELLGRTKLDKHAAGGPLKAPLSAAYMSGGSIKSTSSGTTEVEGNSHAEGGVKVPQIGAEVEGGETTSGNFVFSKELGFAKLHKPIAKTKGIIEKKPQTKERVNAMNYLNSQENKLALSQEYMKHRLGIQ
jgi:hypothetical protein